MSNKIIIYLMSLLICASLTGCHERTRRPVEIPLKLHAKFLGIGAKGGASDRGYLDVLISIKNCYSKDIEIDKLGLMAPGVMFVNWYDLKTGALIPSKWEMQTTNNDTTFERVLIKQNKTYYYQTTGNNTYERDIDINVPLGKYKVEIGYSICKEIPYFVPFITSNKFTVTVPEPDKKDVKATP
jgi:hypothetical protein